MVEQIGVRAVNFRRDGLQRDRLGSVPQQKTPRGLQRGGPAFFGAETFASY
jgi:hypothetical protein